LEIAHFGEKIFPNKKGDTKGEYTEGGGELVSMLQVPVSERCVVVKFLLMQLYVCCRESELVIASLEDRS
jgi:hypothetical protein